MSQPTKPSLAVATEAYQVLLELHRQHPDDGDLAEHKEQAHSLMVQIWHERDATRRSVL